MELGPHLRRIGNDIVAAYLIVTDEGITVVDAGLPGQWNDLQAELRAIGRSPADIRGLIVTHGDSDHLGFAERLRRALRVVLVTVFRFRVQRSSVQLTLDRQSLLQYLPVQLRVSHRRTHQYCHLSLVRA